jgi:hypothetical protein
MRQNRRFRCRWVGMVAIGLYWAAPLWLSQLAVLVGIHPKSGGEPRRWPGLVRVLEIFHWPHRRAMALLGPLLQPRDALFPPGWVIWLTLLIPMALTGVLWWVVAAKLQARRSTSEPP